MLSTVHGSSVAAVSDDNSGVVLLGLYRVTREKSVLKGNVAAFFSFDALVFRQRRSQ